MESLSLKRLLIIRSGGLVLVKRLTRQGIGGIGGIGGEKGTGGKGYMLLEKIKIF